MCVCMCESLCVCEMVWGSLRGRAGIVVGKELQGQVGQEGLTCQNKGKFFWPGERHVTLSKARGFVCVSVARTDL